MKRTRLRVSTLLTITVMMTSCIMDPPDPSYQVCTRYGGRIETRRVAKDVYIAYCVFPDNTECEIRAFYYSKCKAGQIRSVDSSPQKLRMQKLIADLDQRGIKLNPALIVWGDLRPGKSWLGAAIPSGSSAPVGLFETSFERQPSDLFLIRATESITAAQDVERRVPSHVKEYIQPYKPEIDALRYYRCDALIVVYLALPPSGFDPAVGKALTETCGPEFARYSSDSSVPAPPAALQGSGFASIAPPTTTSELIDKAQLIFIGEVGPVVQRRTYSGYGPQGELLDGFNEAGTSVPQLPITDFEVKVERVIKDDGTIASGKPVILRMSGNATPEMKEITRNTDYPFSYTGDRYLFLLTRNPDGTTYGFYHGPWSRLLIDGDALRMSNGSQQLLKLDSSDAPISLEEFIQRVNK